MNPVERSGFRRREFLKQTTAAALLGGMGAGNAAMAATRSASSTLIADENRRPGALDWQLSRVRLTKAGGIRAPAVEGYCSKQWVLAGETLDLFVNTTPAARFTIEIFRTGYYGGRGARLMTTLGPFDGAPPPVP